MAGFQGGALNEGPIADGQLLPTECGAGVRWKILFGASGTPKQSRQNIGTRVETSAGDLKRKAILEGMHR